MDKIAEEQKKKQKR